MSDSCDCGYQYQPPHKESDAARHQAHCVLNFTTRPDENTCIDTGGPAFPAGYHPEGNSADQHGMTLRDWFAGMALQGILASGARVTIPNMAAEIAAISSYRIADAMLAARKECAS